MGSGQKGAETNLRKMILGLMRWSMLTSCSVFIRSLVRIGNSVSGLLADIDGSERSASAVSKRVYLSAQILPELHPEADA